MSLTAILTTVFTPNLVGGGGPLVALRGWTNGFNCTGSALDSEQISSPNLISPVLDWDFGVNWLHVEDGTANGSYAIIDNATGPLGVLTEITNGDLRVIEIVTRNVSAGAGLTVTLSGTFLTTIAQSGTTTISNVPTGSGESGLIELTVPVANDFNGEVVRVSSINVNTCGGPIADNGGIIVTYSPAIAVTG